MKKIDVSCNSIHLLFCRLVETTIGNLIRKVKKKKQSICAGATNDPKQCKNEYKQKGYTGTM